MANETIKTERLVLRPLLAADAADSARLIGDWQVMRWLTSPPWPLSIEDAEWFLGDNSSQGNLAIIINGKFAGRVGCTNDLGYWLGREHWGQGFMSEAVVAVLQDHFSSSSETLRSGYLLGNDASRKVLAKCGFQNKAIEVESSNPLGTDVQLQKMTLNQTNWHACRG